MQETLFRTQSGILLNPGLFIDQHPEQEIRALSWKEPYCTMMIHGKIETRTWDTKYRGWVLGCSSKAQYDFHTVNFNISGGHQCDRIFAQIDWHGQKLGTEGNAIWIGRLVDCRPMTKEDENKCFVRYREPWTEIRVRKDGTLKSIKKRLWCHIYQDVMLIRPFKWEGSQGWKKLNAEQKKLIEIL